MPQRRGKDDLLPPPQPAIQATILPQIIRDPAARDCWPGQTAAFAIITKLASASMTFHFINISDG
jgi:hypothetical protein